MSTLTSVNSSNVKAVGYDAIAQTLSVQFAGGNTYAYIAVPSDVWDELQKCIADGHSVGAWISANIVRKFQFRRREPEAS